MRSIILKRVPLGFDWQMGVIWFGYLFEPVVCECCVGIGEVTWPDESSESHKLIKQTCPVCEGKGKVKPIIEVPKGKGYQIWETMNYMTEKDPSHYYPISPVFEDPFKLATWLSSKFLINDDELLSESTWYEAISEDNVDTVFGLYRDNIKCK